MSKRVVITGMGVISPIGKNVKEYWDSLRSGRSGISSIESFDVSDYPAKIAGEIKELDVADLIEPKEARRTDRTILLSLVAADEAIKDSGLNMEQEDPDICGTIIGSGIGGIQTFSAEHKKLVQRGPSRVSPFLIPNMISDMPAGRVSMAHNLKGPNYCPVSACASGAHAIGDAYLAIQAGMMDVCVTGGTEAPICPIALAGFSNMKALSTRNDTPEKASSPFDKKRDGFVMGEGAGILVIESLEHALARNAKIYGEISGYGATGDAYHISHPAPEGEGARRAMMMALKTAGITPDKIDYINAHGTSTPFNDKYESTAIAATFGEHVQNLHISSTKSMTGHLLGASGAIEYIACALAINNKIVPPTINYEDPDPECPLSYTPNTAVEKEVRYALSNSFGFGGHNASLIIKKYEPAENNS